MALLAATSEADMPRGDDLWGDGPAPPPQPAVAKPRWLRWTIVVLTAASALALVAMMVWPVISCWPGSANLSRTGNSCTESWRGDPTIRFGEKPPPQPAQNHMPD